MEVDGPDISKHGVVVPNGAVAGIAGLVEKPDAMDAPSNLASIGRYVLTPDIFDTCGALRRDQVGKFNWQMRLMSMLSRALSKLCD